MTFQELLTKTRGETWTPPITLIALDPGETTGIAIFSYGMPVLRDQIKLFFIPGGWDPLVDLITKFKPTYLVYEDYKIYPNKVNAHSFSNIPTVKIIGGIEFVCARNGIKTSKMLASTAKGFVTNEKLEEWGFYLKGKQHSMDATRVGCHYLLFSKELT